MSTTAKKTTARKTTKTADRAAAAGARTPADRKPKAPAAPASVEAPTAAEQRAGHAWRTVTFGELPADPDDEDAEPTPLEYEVDLLAFDDVDIYEALELAVTNGGNAAANAVSTLTVMRAMLGGDANLQRWKDEQRRANANEDGTPGRVGIDVMQAFVQTAMTGPAGN